jgi:crotonobetainyl-CoA:carnitine CoA-transferase CaiB-like acyl-CoA transferase
MRVVDLSSEIAGGYCTKVLTDAGADVVKFEPPSGDPLRRWVASGTPLAPGADAPLFQYLHASKRSISGDRAVADAWIARADVVVTTEPLDFASYREADPRLVIVTITPWGASGPWRDRPATEFTVQAACGTTFTRGLPERDPLSVGGRHGEWNVATYGAMGAITAWLHAQRTGIGQHVDVSMFEALHTTMNSPYAALMAQWAPDATLGRTIEVPSIEPALDGWVGFCTQTGQQWKDFCSLVEHPEMGDDPRFVNNLARMPHRLEIAKVVHAFTTVRTVEEICELVALFRVPATPVGNGRSVLEMEHFRERGVFVESPHGFVQPRTPYWIHGRENRPFAPAPRLGEHNEAEVWDARVAPALRDPGTSKPFEGLKVLDISAFWAGPFASSYLGALGADVIKIESIHRPDMMRFGGTPFFGEGAWEWSGVTSGTNSSKRAITLDLDREPGASMIRRLVEWADVIVENMAPRVFDQHGLDWASVRALNEHVILLRMPAFGLDGPWRDRTGWAMTVEQTTGLAWTTGYCDIPVVPRGACDPLGSLHALVALVSAMEERRHTNVGCLVEVALVESAFNIAAEQVIEWTANGVLLHTDENRGPFAAPQGLYPTSTDDRFVAVACATDHQWQALCTVLNNSVLNNSVLDHADLDAAWGSEQRRARHDLIDEVLASWTAQHTPAEAEAALLDLGIPASAVVSPRTLLDNPQMRHRGFLQRMEHPVHGSCEYPGYPIQYSAFGSALHSCPPPTFGQHNDEVLRVVLGLSAEQISELRSSGHIGERPSFV